MKRLLGLAARLYPSWWRRRYATEFEALLEDMKPGWREFFDVVKGAITMQITTLATIPVVCTLAGGLAGGILAMRTPDVFASSATIRLKARETANAESAVTQELRASLETALGASTGTREATSVTLHKDIVTLTYLDGNAAQAQRVAETLTAAIATENAASAEVLVAPRFPTSPMRSDYPMMVGSGGGVGLVAGGVVFLLLRSRRRPATAA